MINRALLYVVLGAYRAVLVVLNFTAGLTLRAAERLDVDELDKRPEPPRGPRVVEFRRHDHGEAPGDVLREAGDLVERMADVIVVARLLPVGDEPRGYMVWYSRPIENDTIYALFGMAKSATFDGDDEWDDKGA